jgi:hypothetical protein
MKVTGSYSPLVQGVSEQTPELRRSGQLGEMVNMIPDPVEGLTRRPGAVLRASTAFTGTPSGWRSIEHTQDGNDYVILYRAGAGTGSVLLAFNKTTNQFIPVQTDPGDPFLISLTNNGVAAIASAGNRIYIAANNTPVVGTSTQKWNAGNLADKAAVWFRGPAYNRRFRLTFQKTGAWSIITGTGTGLSIDANDSSKAYAEYTTVSSQYGGTLNTSDIPASASDYQKQVNDRVNAYNSAVNQWITSAAKDVVPQAVAGRFIQTLLFSTIPVTPATPNTYATKFDGLRMELPRTVDGPQPLGATLFFSGLTNITATDDGNGELIRAVGNDVSSVTDVTTHHWFDKVVRVKASGTSPALYLKAVKKSAADSGTFGEVTWVETPGVEHSISSGLFFAKIKAGVVYLAGSATRLALLTGDEEPDWAVSQCGDDDTSPRPHFVGKQITMLAVFQERLFIGSGSTVSVSASKDYLNFFRKSVTTLTADDAFEMAPAGSSSDTLRSSVLFNKDLVIFGDSRQYGVGGGNTLTPAGANMSVRANIADASAAPPVVTNNLVFYAQPGERASSVHQIVTGVTEDSLQSYSVSTQLVRYLLGAPVELSSHAKPDILLFRTSAFSDRLFTFFYLDTDQGRRQDAWGTWRFDPGMGTLLTMARESDGPLLFFHKSGTVSAYVVPVSGGVSDRPFLDGLSQFAGAVPDGASVAAGNVTGQGLRYYGIADPTNDSASTLGAAVAASGEQLWVGWPMDSYFTLTNPYPLDQKGAPITTGTTTVTSFAMSYKDTVGFSWTIKREGRTDTGEFEGRIMGDPNNLVGIVPVARGTRGVLVWDDVRKFTITFRATAWFPLTITTVEWVGQLFNNVRRG